MKNNSQAPVYFKEYQPKGGWLKHRRRQAIKEGLISASLILGLVLAYVFVAHLESMGL